MNSIKVCEYSRSRSFHDDLILQDQASGERYQDHWSSGSLNDMASMDRSAFLGVFKYMVGMRNPFLSTFLETKRLIVVQMNPPMGCRGGGEERANWSFVFINSTF